MLTRWGAAIELIMPLLPPLSSSLSSSTEPITALPPLSPSTSSPSPHFHPSQSSKKLSEFYKVPLQGDRIRKVACKRREHKRTIAKLRRMLPHEQNVVQCSELELINHIINYITSLQEMLRSQENIPDENNPSTIDIANLNRALSHFHLCTNKRQPLRPSKRLCI
ncbi:unnamed protein product [Litomosoides sigmodontis]|uniref:BHLH domain-containing protein n=1 Tax=Litomosoides sigmodontis TaxID=42156 RepID=A0A3P6TJL8_LITSI|nr:unnamed protein product [Litomosoides sigmodontis]